MTLAHVDEGSGDPVVLLHAFPCDHTMWDAQAAALVAAGHRVIRPDLPGFGASEVPAAAPGLDHTADEVAALLAQLGVQRAAVAGLSLGGYVAMAMLRRHPGLFGSLILADTKAGADAEQAREGRRAMAAAVVAAGSTEPVVDAMLTGLLGGTTRDQRPEVVARVRGWVLRAEPAAIEWTQHAMLARPDSHADLAGFAGPAMIVWGSQDSLSPRPDQDAMLVAMPQARFELIEGSGHLSAVERPDAVSAALLDFLSGSGSATA